MLKFVLIAAIAAAASALEYDQCARPFAEWAGIDAGFGRSRGHAVAYSAGTVFVAGYAIGNLSLHTMHTNGDYSDHESTRTEPANIGEVTVHHDSETFTDPNYYKRADMTQHGMDATLYKISEAGVPQMVFSANTRTFDGIYTADSVNGLWSGYVQFSALDGFAAEGEAVAGTGWFRGNLTFPMADSATKTLANAQKRGHYYGFVSKVDMATGEATWATDAGMRESGVYPRSTATTAAGHVLVSGNKGCSGWSPCDFGPGVGFLNLYNGADGENEGSVMFDHTSGLPSVDAVGEIAYVSGLFEGFAVDLLAAGTELTSSSNGTKDDAFVAALDAGTWPPTPQWVVQLGGSSGHPSVKAEGDYLYAAGSLTGPSTIGTCVLTGTLGGYLAKLSRATGVCQWARDTPPSSRAVSDGTHVWTVQTSSRPVEFGDSHTLASSGVEDDVFMAKYRASDGVGLWAHVIGGTGDDVADDMAITPSGPVFSGSTQSEAVSLGNVTLRNLQHETAEARNGFDPDASHAANAGQRSLFVMLVSSTDEVPPCVSCPSGELSAADTTIAAGYCYSDGVCVDDGAFSHANYPARSCLKCDAATSQLELSAPDTSNACYFDGRCHPKGERGRGYSWRNEASACEWCDPAVSTTSYTRKPSFAHDRTMAKTTGLGANDFGIVFQDWANGCQVLPDVVMPANPSSQLTSALALPTSGTAEEVGERATNAIAALQDPTLSNQGAAGAAAWYGGNPESCTLASAGACMFTPAETADAMGAAFETTTHYGQSISRIKSMQGLWLLQEELAGAAQPAQVADLATDIKAHLLIAFYQGVIKAAYDVDTDTDAASARADGAAYWKVINDATDVDDFDPADRSRLSEMFSAPTSSDFNYCTAVTLLLRNLPPASQLQYSSDLVTGKVVASAADEVVHLTAADVGVLTASRTPPEPEGEAKVCHFPPPSPPPSPLPSPPPCSTIAELVAATSYLSQLETTLTLADASVLAALDDPSRTLTLFAPSNAAFESLGSSLSTVLGSPSTRSDNQKVTSILKKHVLESEVRAAAALLLDSAAVVTWKGEEIAVDGSSGSVTVAPSVFGGPSTVTVPDLLACNGVVHVIDKMLALDTDVAPPSPPPSDIDDPPCFPSSATVQRADGTFIPLSSLAAGDSILAAAADGTLGFDVTSSFSLADPSATAAFLSLATASATVTLTPTHKLPAGPAKALKQASEVAVGETIWLASPAAGALVQAPVLEITEVVAEGLHSPLTKHGGWPVVDGVATSYNDAAVVARNKYLVPLVEAVCPSLARLVVAAANPKPMHYIDGEVVEPLSSLVAAVAAVAVAVGAVFAARKAMARK